MGLIQEWTSAAQVFFSRQDKIIEPLPPGTSFAGKSILVTGATSGLGLEAAIIYVQHDAEIVYITARDEAKGATAKALIEGRTGKKGVVRVITLDMDSFTGVEKFVQSVKTEIKSIDIVLLNAGLWTYNYQPLADGWEGDLQVNALSTTLLALLLLPWMQAVATADQVPHLTFTGSGSHMEPNIGAPGFPQQDILKHFNEKSHYQPGSVQYGISKLLLMYASREIASLALGRSGTPCPIVNSVCPGLIKTDISRSFRNRGIVFKWIESLFMWWKSIPASEGAKALVVATMSYTHGSFRRPYMTDDEYAEKAKQNVTSAEGQKMQAQVWGEILAVLKENVPEGSTSAGL